MAVIVAKLGDEPSPRPPRRTLLCPVCISQPLEFALRLSGLDIFNCLRCGSTLSVPLTAESANIPK